MLDKLKKKYEQSPTFVKKLYSKIPFSVRMRAQYRNTLNFLHESERWPKERLQEYQYLQLKKLLEHAYNNVPYYNRIFNERGLKPQDIKSAQDMEKLPLLDKQIIKKNFNDLIARNIPKTGMFLDTTGGTTGEPLQFYINNSAYRIEWAFMMNQWGRVKYRPGDKRVTFRGREVKKSNALWEENPIYNEVRFSIYDMTNENLWKYIQKIKEINPKYILGYPSVVCLLAQFILDNNIEDFPNINAVLASSEGIYPFQIEFMEKAFKCRIYSWYGHTEKAVLAGACEVNDKYHILPQYGVTEIVDSAGQIVKNGEIVGTSFLNYAMPFIRYKTGDMAILKSGSCPCGRNYELIDQILGRTQEFVVTKNGRLISITGMVFGLHIDEYKHIKRFQLFQDKEGEVIVKIAKGKDFRQEHGEAIIKKYESVAKGGIKIDLVYVNEDELSIRGKYKYLVQNLDIEKYLKSLANQKSQLIE